MQQLWRIKNDLVRRYEMRVQGNFYPLSCTREIRPTAWRSKRPPSVMLTGNEGIGLDLASIIEPYSGLVFS